MLQYSMTQATHINLATRGRNWPEFSAQGPAQPEALKHIACVYLNYAEKYFLRNFYG